MNNLKFTSTPNSFPHNKIVLALWIRLSLRKAFPLALDDFAKKFIWDIICDDDSLELFLLTEPRPPLVVFNRYDFLDPELETICEPVSVTYCNFLFELSNGMSHS